MIVIQNIGRYFVATVLFFSLCISALGQDGYSPKTIADSVEFVKQKMRLNGKITSYAISFDGQISVQFQRFLFLKFHLSNDELEKMTRDVSACLRVYGYMALLHNKYSQVERLRSQMLTDTSSLVTLSGCELDHTKVNTFIERIYEWYNREFFIKLTNDYVSFREYFVKNFVFSKSE